MEKKKMSAIHNQVFVSMPFTAEYENVYELAIKPSLSENGFESIFLLDFPASKNLLDFIINSIKESAFMIANVSQNNSNVLFEVGIAIGLGKKVILIIDEDSNVSSDLLGFHIIRYKGDNYNELNEEISKIINNKDFQDSINEQINYRIKSVYVSYTWESKEHKEWIVKLSEKLMENGIKVYLDDWYMKLGMSYTKFAENIKNVDFVLLIITENYMRKFRIDERGIKMEIDLLKNTLEEDLESGRIIPLIRERFALTPPFLGRRLLHWREDDNYEEKLETLIRHIYSKPGIQPPPLGKKPAFD